MVQPVLMEANFDYYLLLPCSLAGLACLGDSCPLAELTLDGNPVALETWYKQAVLRCVLHLKQLDMKRITVRPRPSRSPSP